MRFNKFAPLYVKAVYISVVRFALVCTFLLIGAFIGPEACAASTDSAPKATAAIYVNGLLVGTGFVIGSHTQGSDRQLLVLVQKSMIESQSRNVLRVSLAQQPTKRLPVTDFKLIDFKNAYHNDRRTIARQSHIPLTKVDRILEVTSDDNAAIVLFVPSVQGDEPTLTIIDDSCRPAPGSPHQLQLHYAGTNGFHTVPWKESGSASSRLNRQILTGGLVSSNCGGSSNVQYFLVASEEDGRGQGYEKALIADVIESVKLILQASMNDLHFTFKYNTSGVVTDCPGLNGRAMVAHYLFNEGDRIKVDEIPERQNELRYVSYKNQKIKRPSMGENARPQLYTWGKNSQSKELFLLWATRGKFIFERYCKANLRPRGRLKGNGQFSGSQDSGWDFFDGSFLLALGDGTAIYSSSRLPQPLRVKKAPKKLEQVNKVTIHGNDVLVGWSGATRSIQYVVIPNELSTTTRDSSSPTVNFNWRSWNFPDDIVGSRGQVHLKIDGPYISLLTDKGIAVAQLDINQNRVSLIRKFLASEHENRFGSKKPHLIGSTIIRYSKTSNFALVAVYSQQKAGELTSKEHFVIAPVFNGQFNQIYSINNKRAFSRQAAKMKTDHYGSEERERMFELKISKVNLTLDTASEMMERFYGALIIEVEFIKSLDDEDRSQIRKDNFKIYYPIHFWYNKFDRMWEAIRITGGARPKNLCSGFNFLDINVIVKRRRPKRIILPRKACGNSPPVPAQNQVMHIPIIDDWGAQPLNLNAADSTRNTVSCSSLECIDDAPVQR